VEPGLVEHLHCVGRHLASGVRPGRLVRLADAAGVEGEHAEALGQPGHDWIPAPARVAESLHEQHPRARPAGRPGDLPQPRTALNRASPPGAKKTTRMKRTPSTNSGCCRGVERSEGSFETACEPERSPRRWFAHV